MNGRDYPIVYHHTSHEAALSILLHEEIRLSNIQYFNDGREFWHLHDILDAYLSSRAQSNDPVPERLAEHLRRIGARP